MKSYNEYLKRVLSMLLAVVLLLTAVQPGALAANGKKTGDVQTYSMVVVNPLYEGIITEADILEAAPPKLYAGSAQAEVNFRDTMEDLGADVRRAMENRSGTIAVYYKTANSFSDDTAKALIRGAFLEALEETGKSTQGDYLRWVYGGYSANMSRQQIVAGVSYWIITYTVDYYTTLAQEQALTAALAPVMAGFGFTDQTTEYAKIKTIYDYICGRVTYDNANLNNDSYKLKFTAYAAMVNRTAVCQGYATLLYRMLTEAGVSVRVIAGTGNGGAHAWNIVRIGSLYYDVDSTWDAGRSKYGYFLKCDAHFGDHVRDIQSSLTPDYSSAAFYQAYPMSETDYSEHSYSTSTTEATCTEPGYTVYTCSHCGDKYQVERTAALGHKTVVQSIKAATCTEKGYTGDEICTVCRKTIRQGSAVPATGHKTTVKNAKAASCTGAGYTGDTVCTVCNAVTKAGTAIPAAGHRWDDGKVTKAPTATETGVKTYTCTVCGETKTGEIPATSGTVTPSPTPTPGVPTVNFVDVPPTEYYAEAVQWAVSENITNGMDIDAQGNILFVPGSACTRAQAVMFLWRAAGEPEPENADNPFVDVIAGEYYYQAVLWAVEKGITNGTSAVEFSPNITCNRAQIVTFLYRYEGEPEAARGGEFYDVPTGEYYYIPVLWAVSRGVTNGTAPDMFSPMDSCTRAQIVTFLWRDLTR